MEEAEEVDTVAMEGMEEPIIKSEGMEQDMVAAEGEEEVLETKQEAMVVKV